MRTTLLTNVFNEEYLLPFWLEHHKKIFDDMESKYRTLRGRYRFLLFKLRKTSPETYRTFKELETNDI